MNNTTISCIVLFTLCVVHAATATRLYALTAENNDGLSLATHLNDLGLPVYGLYGDLVVVSKEKSGPNNLIHPSVLHSIKAQQVVDLGDDSGLWFYVLERQERLGVQFTQSLSVPQNICTTLYSSFNRLIVSSKHEILNFPTNDDFEVLPLTTKVPIHLGVRPELLPAVKEIYSKASKKYTAAPNPTIVELVNAVDSKDLKGFVTYLTGEDPLSNILSRNSISQGAKDAALWIQKNFEAFDLNVTTQEFRTDYSPNVIGIKNGVTDPSKIVVIGAHYDSRGTERLSATQRAPGANDNGSGSGAVLQIAKIFKDASFDYTIHFIVYSGEEQGLYGSAAYAQKLLTEKATVIGVFNADMIAYRVPTEKTQCAFPSRYSTPDLEAIAREAVATYVPELTVGITTACCSDHQSYYNLGFPATGFFERNGAIADPQYHRSEDLVARTGYDVEGEYTQLTKATLASVATVAGVITPEK